MLLGWDPASSVSAIQMHNYISHYGGAGDQGAGEFCRACVLPIDLRCSWPDTSVLGLSWGSAL